MLPPLDALQVHVVSLPMRVAFRGVLVREAVLLHGPAGWGEFAPFLEYEDAEAAHWLAGALEAACDGFPASVRDSVPVNATVPAVAADQVAAVLARFPGCRTAKVKVAETGQSLDDDVSRVSAVRAVMGPDARIRVDANGGWSVPDALTALGRLAAYGLEYAEQPCPSVAELAALRVRLARKGIDVLVAADESIRKAADPLRVVHEGAADLVILKVAPLGGVRRALDIARECGLPSVVSSALDTSVGIAAGVALAAALPELGHACGLGTVELLAADVATPSLVPVGGSIAVGRAQVDEALVEKAAAAPDRVAWWRERMTRCYEVLDC